MQATVVATPLSVAVGECRDAIKDQIQRKARRKLVVSLRETLRTQMRLMVPQSIFNVIFGDVGRALRVCATYSTRRLSGDVFCAAIGAPELLRTELIVPGSGNSDGYFLLHEVLLRHYSHPQHSMVARLEFYRFTNLNKQL